ncbi:MAG: right-handed parallel beta-helix repeat-containing protein [Alphaproteobacteria bacterium]|nr:right-handed parallel beta-helix repeat-containing protein [Alphaproteobacteria bacterium]
MQTKKQKMIIRPAKYILWTVIFCFYASFSAQAKTWLVGPDFLLHKPSEAIKLAKDGDIIKIVAGLYENDYAIINQNDLTIEGVNGIAHLKSSGLIPGGKAIWVTNGANITIRNIEFSGARVTDKNGAGIRLQGGSLTLQDCYFHNNEMGILTSGKSDISLFINKSEFSRNTQDYSVTEKLSHNIYVGTIAVFLLENSISRGAVYGHTVKSRAQITIIRNNRIFDEGDISASYLIDIPNGGQALIENNYLFKNKGAQNNALISYGTEGMRYDKNYLTIKYNTAISEADNAILLRNRSNVDAKILRNDLTRVKSDKGIMGGFWHKIKEKIKNVLR